MFNFDKSNCTMGMLEDAEKQFEDLINYYRVPLDVTPYEAMLKVMTFSLNVVPGVYTCQGVVESIITNRKNMDIQIISDGCFINSTNPSYGDDPCCSPSAALTKCCAPRLTTFETQRITGYNQTVLDTCLHPSDVKGFIYNFYRTYIESYIPSCQTNFQNSMKRVQTVGKALTKCSKFIENPTDMTPSNVNDFANCWVDSLPKGSLRNLFVIMNLPIDTDQKLSLDEIKQKVLEYMLLNFGQEMCMPNTVLTSKEDCEKQVCNVGLSSSNCTDFACGTDCGYTLFGGETFCKSLLPQFKDEDSCVNTTKSCLVGGKLLPNIKDESLCRTIGSCSVKSCQTCNKNTCEATGVCEEFPYDLFVSNSQTKCLVPPIYNNQNDLICKNPLANLTKIGCVLDSSNCNGIGGVEIKIPTTQQECFSFGLCRDRDGDLTFKKLDVCQQCGGTALKAFTWTPGVWNAGEWKSNNKWLERKLINSYSKWKRSLHWVGVASLMYKLISMETFPQLMAYASCTVSPVLKSLKRIVCDCIDKKNNDCFAKPFINLVGAFTPVQTLYKYRIGDGFSAIFKKIAIVKTIEVEKRDLMAFKEENGKRDLLQTTNGNVEVVDSSNKVVGNVVGDGYRAKVSNGDEVTICLRVDPSLKNSTFTSPKISKLSNSNTFLVASEVSIDTNSTSAYEICGSVVADSTTANSTYYPAYVLASFAVSIASNYYLVYVTMMLLSCIFIKL
ncbi:hypothetical protein ABK040_009127 [Willaertia magna]